MLPLFQTLGIVLFVHIAVHKIGREVAAVVVVVVVVFSSSRSVSQLVLVVMYLTRGSGTFSFVLH